MAIDLSALEGFDTPLSGAAPATAVPPAPAPTGKPLEIMLIDIEEDPNQPRTEFDQEALDAMTESVKASGVISPVSVRPHPTRSNAWILNHGARRYRASVAAGKKTIPAFVDDKHGDYEQVIENLQRDDLTPMELATFIQRKINDGDSKGKIAKRLGKPNTFVSIHLALLDMPAPIADAYHAGKIKAARAVYELRGLHDKNPDAVAAWLAEQEDVTYRAVELLGAELKGKAKAPKGPQPGAQDFARAKSGGQGEGGAGGGSDGGQGSQGNAGKDEGGGKGEGGGGEGDSGRDSAAAVQKIPAHNPAHEKALTTKGKDDPQAIKKAVLLVEYDERPAMVLLNRRPSTQGLLYIKYEDNGEEVEVDAGRCKINCLIEATN